MFLRTNSFEFLRTWDWAVRPMVLITNILSRETVLRHATRYINYVDICKRWMWYPIDKRCFDNFEKRRNKHTKEIGLVFLVPRCFEDLWWSATVQSIHQCPKTLQWCHVRRISSQITKSTACSIGFFRITTKNDQSFSQLADLRATSVTCGLPAQKATNANALPWCDVIMITFKFLRSLVHSKTQFIPGYGDSQDISFFDLCIFIGAADANLFVMGYLTWSHSFRIH